MERRNSERVEGAIIEARNAAVANGTNPDAAEAKVRRSMQPRKGKEAKGESPGVKKKVRILARWMSSSRGLLR